MNDFWRIAKINDPVGRSLADRHYSRRTPGARNFAPPGRSLVLVTHNESAVWVTSWPYARFVDHAWAGAWINSLFRNEGTHLSSMLIREAVKMTLIKWPDIPELGLVSFVNLNKIRPKRDPGRCFLKAGFEPDGYTKSGLLCLRLKADDILATSNDP